MPVVEAQSRARNIFVVSRPFASRRSSAPKELFAQVFISPATCRRLSEDGVAVDSQLQVALAVERHRGDLAERILIEHPAVAPESSVGDVAKAFRPSRLAGSPGRFPEPLPVQIAGISLPTNLRS